MFDPFGMDMSAPITFHRAGPYPGGSASFPRQPAPPPPTPREECAKTWGQPPVTRPELGLYPWNAWRDAPFRRVRSHWGYRGTADTENNPLIGLPNQHIVGLTYVP
ncbi:Putative protein (modular protein) [Streptomyces ambofaciens ATCC 23877]|uniref:Uncharacterized protein n=1 Tax=Streptomyces ambofaciens (strain ATCC 23877 / 3486 / DSM 40053 / JCM 4204 / NBRC 12836 / NRRL B-2516) TaxID=278992 RepID=A0A0K2AM42_STRA7|nr:Putative protein (modular protein) [Streptomyces ambofaciens ATCC 23877]